MQHNTENCSHYKLGNNCEKLVSQNYRRQSILDSNPVLGNKKQGLLQPRFLAPHREGLPARGGTLEP
jgi:hypothetical protein